MSLKIYDVTPEGEAKIIDLLDKVFSKDNEADDLQSMDEVDFWHYDSDMDILPDCNPDVIMKRKDSYIRASNCALEYYRQSDMYSIFACPVTKEQIKAAFLSFYRGDDEFLRDFKWQPMTLFPKKYSAEYCNVSRDAAISRQNAREFFSCLLHSLWVIPLGLIFGVFYAAFWIIKKIFSAVKSCCAKGRCKFWI